MGAKKGGKVRMPIGAKERNVHESAKLKWAARLLGAQTKMGGKLVMFDNATRAASW